jgi:hypothetical protein
MECCYRPPEISPSMAKRRLEPYRATSRPGLSYRARGHERGGWLKTSAAKYSIMNLKYIYIQNLILTSNSETNQDNSLNHKYQKQTSCWQSFCSVDNESATFSQHLRFQNH